MGTQIIFSVVLLGINVVLGCWYLIASSRWDANRKSGVLIFLLLCIGIISSIALGFSANDNTTNTRTIALALMFINFLFGILSALALMFSNLLDVLMGTSSSIFLIPEGKYTATTILLLVAGLISFAAAVLLVI